METPKYSDISFSMRISGYFLALMEDGSYQLIEVKGDNKIDDEVVLAKKAAAEEMAVASGVHYLMYAGSTLMKSNVLEPTLAVQQTNIDI